MFPLTYTVCLSYQYDQNCSITIKIVIVFIFRNNGKIFVIISENNKNRLIVEVTQNILLFSIILFKVTKEGPFLSISEENGFNHYDEEGKKWF